MLNNTFHQLKIAFILLIILTLITGLFYPIAITLYAECFFSKLAHGSIIQKNNKPIGSMLIGQNFMLAQYFWGRPSATQPVPYNSLHSTGSNSAPGDIQFLAMIKKRVTELQQIQPGQPVPIHLVTASSSGLDPDISLDAARYQVARIAKARGISGQNIEHLIDKCQIKRTLGVLGENRVNVLQLNILLDDMYPMQKAAKVK